MHGDIRDIKHVVILMQENRSFDHYFGALRGVRGFADRATILLPGGDPVWQQPGTPPGDPVTSTQYPWPLSDGTFRGAQPPADAPQAGAQNMAETDHSWRTQHGAWHGGLMNAWQHAKDGPATMGFLRRADIPFHYALADAYTIGDAYYCSVLGPTGPNRTYLWSGTVNAGREHGSYVAHDNPDEVGSRLPWESYPETLQHAGVSWKVYQGTDNYGDNGALYFARFAALDPAQGGTAAPGDPWYDNGVAAVPEPDDPDAGNAANLALAIRNDVLAGALPQVSWVVTNQRYSEHPHAAPADGAFYLGLVLQALNADPDVFNTTLVIVDYDENDGLFDHVPPPVPPAGTAGECYLDTQIAPVPVPVGLGFRVPLLLISPWTRGGWVTSEVSDHSSVIQFLERWTTALGTPAICPNISAWRRAVCGDLVHAFDFGHPVYGLPDLPCVTEPVGWPRPYWPLPAGNAMPEQEPGSRPARPLPCQPNANLDSCTAGDDGGLAAALSFSNHGPHVRRACHFAVYDNTAPAATLADYPANFPAQYTIAPATSREPAVRPCAGTGTVYDLTVIGPNRFLRRFTGDISVAGATAHVTAAYYPDDWGGDAQDPDGPGDRPRLLLTLTNGGSQPVTFTVTPDHYPAQPPCCHEVPPDSSALYAADPVVTANGWYDVTVTISGDASWSRRYTGHLETGEPSVSG